MSVREHTYYLKIKLQRMSLGDTENSLSQNFVLVLLNIDVYDKESKMFPKKIGQQRRDVIKMQQLIHLNSNAMKTISGSTYQKKLSSLEEIIVSCH